MAGFFEGLGDWLRDAGKGMARHRAAAVRTSEKALRVQRLKDDIRELREQKEEKMKGLAHRVYDMYIKGTLQDPDLLAACQDIKTLQWQIDERWTEVNHLKAD